MKRGSDAGKEKDNNPTALPALRGLVDTRNSQPKTLWPL